MTPEQRDAHYLVDLFNHAHRIGQFLQGVSREEFDRDAQTRAAVQHHLLIVGEVAGRLTTRFTATHPEIPWHNLVAMRNRLIHDYDQIDLEIVWIAATARVPDLIRFLKPLLPIVPGDEI